MRYNTCTSIKKEIVCTCFFQLTLLLSGIIYFDWEGMVKITLTNTNNHGIDEIEYLRHRHFLNIFVEVGVFSVLSLYINCSHEKT